MVKKENRKYKFCNKVREYRKTLGLNQTELGNLVGLSRNSIASIERGEFEPSSRTMFLISKCLNKPVEEVF